MGRAITLARGTGAPSGAGAGTLIDLKTAIFIYGKTNTGSGSGQLWKWEQDGASGAGDWYPYGEPFTINSAVNSGKFSARYGTDADVGGYFYLQCPSSVSESMARGIGL